MPKLTKRVVEAAAPGEHDYIIWCDGLPGFGVRVFPSGKRSYLIQYRSGGRTRRYTLGLHGVLTADMARKEAEELLPGVKRGRADPSAERKRERRTPTVAEVADRYLSEHVAHHNKPSTRREARRLVEKHIKPTFGKTKVDRLTRAEIKRWHHALRDTPRQANHALSILQKMLSLAAFDWELRSDNPAKGIKRYSEVQRERFLTDEELRRLGEVLHKAEAEGTQLAGVIAAIRLLALTGGRLSELLSLRWEDVDPETGALRLSDAKAGSRVIPPAAPIAAVLAKMDRRGEWLVSGPDASKPLSASTLESAWRRIRALAGLDDVRLHDLRHTKGTYAGQAHLNAFMVRDMLGHKTLAMTGRYVSRDADPLREANERVAGRIAAALDGGAAGEVVPLVGKRQGG